MLIGRGLDLNEDVPENGHGKVPANLPQKNWSLSTAPESELWHSSIATDMIDLNNNVPENGRAKFRNLSQHN